MAKLPGQQNASNVYPLRLRTDEAARLIKAAAQDSDKVIFSDHAQERMAERGFDIADVFWVLENGHVYQDPVLESFEWNGNEHKLWNVIIEKNFSGNRDIGAVTIILQDGDLFIKTVEWIDT